MESTFCLVPKLWLGNVYFQSLLDVQYSYDHENQPTHQAELGNRHSQTGVWERENVYHHHAAQCGKPIGLYALHIQDTLWR